MGDLNNYCTCALGANGNGGMVLWRIDCLSFSHYFQVDKSSPWFHLYPFKKKKKTEDLSYFSCQIKCLKNKKNLTFFLFRWDGCRIRVLVLFYLVTIIEDLTSNMFITFFFTVDACFTSYKIVVNNTNVDDCLVIWVTIKNCFVDLVINFPISHNHVFFGTNIHNHVIRKGN